MNITEYFDETIVCTTCKKKIKRRHLKWLCFFVYKNECKNCYDTKRIKILEQQYIII